MEVLCDDTLLSQAKAAELLFKSKSWLAKRTHTNDGPPVTFIGNTPLYRVGALRAYIRQQEATTRSEG